MDLAAGQGEIAGSLKYVPDDGTPLRLVSAECSTEHVHQLRFHIVGAHLDRVGEELAFVRQLDRIAVTHLT